MRTIQYKNLAQIFQEKTTSDILKRIDHRSFSEAVILAMLINPEDGRWDNYMLEPFSIGNEVFYRIVSIDNDHAFVRPLSAVPGPKDLWVKTALYCLDQMKEPLHPEVCERLVNSIEPYQLLKNWLMTLQTQQKKINRLFFGEELEKNFQEPAKRLKKALKDNKIDLDIVFKPSLVADVYQKIMRVQAILRMQPHISMLKLLRQVIPEIGIRYRGAFKRYSTPNERFNYLTTGCFEKWIVKSQRKFDFYLTSVIDEQNLP